MIGASLRLALLAALLAAAWSFRDQYAGVLDSLGTAGLAGVAAMAGYHLLSVGLCGLAWSSLLAGGRPGIFLFGRWVREGVGELAGFLPLSGEVAGARQLVRQGIRPAIAAALTVVDVTAEVAAQFLFTLLGLGLWLWRHPSAEITHWGLIGLGASLPVLAALVLVQRSSLVLFLETLPSRLMPHLWKAPEAEAGLHAAIAILWSDHLRIVRAVAIHLSAWTVSAGGAWLGLLLLGHPLPLADVVAMESLIFALRSAAFAIPSAIGVQEGGYLLVGAALGLSAETALALSLLKRGSDLALGLPALAAWHWLEGRPAAKAPAAKAKVSPDARR